MCVCGEMLIDKDSARCGDALLRIIGHPRRDRAKPGAGHDDGQAIEHILRHSLCRIARDGERHLIEICCISLHDECFSIAAECLIGTDEHIPRRMTHRASAQGASAAGQRRLCIPVMEEIACSKYVRMW